ncbi:DNA-binding response regulator [Leptospira gomenensis]|uniref:DNA-binding response regulator n=1 Tax=Leptospira gomenensis TaxID=2484974 RepID=A0A5F1YAU7_9LEPT|nr:response regulator transcription factor [Leptospira gomenensis]TGK34529.1 DNA-binding response regulator [Leptospira gomenensis]TGK40161.1 DNA-binding response regulator [Leptospira gomenensis]TGK41914.1 DNA-binding response regulator [Leptospira gomenensis]TGK55670.1 DNA-binding response regulator [Leptospira gomenensis]
MKPATKIFLVDDHAILREGLKMILSEQPGLEICGESGDAEKALDQIGKLSPDLVITDISMPGLSGIDLVKNLRKYYPQIRSIILSRHDNKEYVQKLLELGINGYVLKDDAGNDLLRAIEAVHKGETYLSPGITSHFLSGFVGGKQGEENQDARKAFSVLSDREREILKLVAEGNSNEAIGKILRISPATVKVHRANIMKKLDLHKVADLVMYAIRAGLIES